MERARSKARQKRSGYLHRFDIDAIDVAVIATPDQLLAIDEAMDKLKARLGSCVLVLASKDEGKVTLIAGVSNDLTARIKAGELVSFVAQQVGGKGGGKPDMAQAGGNDPAKLPAALASVASWVAGRL